MVATAKLVVLDRDGVINYDSDEYIKSEREWHPLPGSLEAIARLTAAGYRVVVISNQSGVGRGLLDLATLAKIHRKMTADIEAHGGRLAGIYYCPHTPDEGCDCRKPKAGLLYRMQSDMGLGSLENVPLIGDKESDLELARVVGARGILVRTGKGARTLATLDGYPDVESYADLAAAVDALLGTAAS